MANPQLAVNEQQVAQLRGSVMNEARTWIREHYGEDLYKAALAALTPEERAIIDGGLFPSVFYPILAWDHFLDAARAEAHRRHGDSELQFDEGNMRGAGSLILKVIYKFVFRVMKAESVLAKLPDVFGRLFNRGRIEIVENVAGRCVFRFTDIDTSFRSNLIHHLPTGTEYILEQT